MDKHTTGLYNKFNVTRTDGTSEPGRKHHDCEYFVLDVTHDKHSHAALLAYADSCEAEFPFLARDLRIQAKLQTIGPSTFFGKTTKALLAALPPPAGATIACPICHVWTGYPVEVIDHITERHPPSFKSGFAAGLFVSVLIWVVVFTVRVP